jgi:hypothetical protein
VTEEQYLALERAAEFKSEFLDGGLFAMSGFSRILPANFMGALVAAAVKLSAPISASRCQAGRTFTPMSQWPANP